MSTNSASLNDTNCIKYLVLDTETNGLPRDYKAPASAIRNWPRLVQIAWICYDSDQSPLKTRSFIIRPQGFAIPADAARIHGITDEIARIQGHDLLTVLKLLSEDLQEVACVVAHNANFDTKVVRAEYCRLGIPDPLANIKTICTMESATNLCKLPGQYGFKYPRLEELHTHLFHRPPQACHNAEADAATAAKCFWELRRLGIV